MQPEGQVWMYRVLSAPPESWVLLTEMGYRRSKHGNWYRYFDNRIPGIVEKRLHHEMTLDRLGLRIEITPLRSRAAAARTQDAPSAKAWLKRNDRPSKLDRLRQVRKRSRQLRAQRRAAAP